MVNALDINERAEKEYRSWAIELKENSFFLDTWSWDARPYLDGGTLGETEFGGCVTGTEADALKMAEAECVKRGIFEAVLLR